MENNIDIRPVFNHCKVVTYTCAYFYKADNETSKTMKQVAKEAYQSGKSALEKMKAIPRVYSRKKKCSVQEAVHLLMPELWLRKTFSKVIFLNSDVCEKD